MEKFTIRRVERKDVSLLVELVKGLAEYEKRPWDMTGTKEQMEYWLFDRNIATSFIAELDGVPVGYAIYYPVFGSFSAKGKVHLEDIFLKEEYRGKGLGKKFMALVVEDVINNGYEGMEWSCLDWNESSICFYDKLGAEKEKGRVYFDFSKKEMQNILRFK